MSSSTENRLSYASSPESDLEVSPPPAPRLVKSSSDPSIATTQDNMDRDDDMNHMADAVPPPYTQGGYDSKYGFASNSNGQSNGVNHSQSGHVPPTSDAPPYQMNPMAHSPPHSPLYGTVPELPPRSANRASVPPVVGGVALPAPPRPMHQLRHTTPNRPSAQERLFGGQKEVDETATYTARPTSMVLPQSQGSLDRHRHNNQHPGNQHSGGQHPGNQHPGNQHSSNQLPGNQHASNQHPGNQHQNSYESAPSYEYSASVNGAGRLPPNAPDDLKVAPPPMKMDPPPPANPTLSQSPQRNSNSHEHSSLEYRTPENTYRPSDNYRTPQIRPPMNGNSPHAQAHMNPQNTHNVHNPQNTQNTHISHNPHNSHNTHNTHAAPAHARGPSLPNVPTNDHAKYSSARTNSASQADYGARAYKPVPPPKPKHYRAPDLPRAPTMDGPGGAGGGAAPQFAHAHSHSQPAPRPHPQAHAHSNYHQGVYGGGQMGPQGMQSPPYAGPPHHRAINLPHNPHLIDLAGSREQRGSAFELYRKPQHMHNMSSTDAMNTSMEPDESFSPKTKKKLSKKPSFIKNAVLDLFRSKTKNSQKVSRQKSLCESDLQQRYPQQMPMLRREKSDLGDLTVHMRNTQIRNQMLQRSNSSSCEKPVLKPILKRQSSFCDDRNGSICTVRDYDTKPVVKSLRRQSSMCEMETEPKVTPLLRRQNSLIEYNRRAPAYHNSSFNMITKIDPIYQRQQQIKHEPFYPTQPLPPEPMYQSKENVVYDPIPKPRRTYASLYDTSSENPYATQSEISNQSFESNYGNRDTLTFPVTESPYATRAECIRDNPYATKNEMIENPYACKQDISKRSESFYSESPYSSKEQMLRSRMTESPYATKEEMLRQRFSESPYNTKEEMLKQRIEGTLNSKEPIYGKRTYEPPANASWSESSYSIRPDRRLHTPIHFPGRISPMSKCMSEPPYASRTEMLGRLGQTESPYGTRSEVKSSCSDNNYNIHNELPEIAQNKRPASAECTYVSKQEILSQKAALLLSKDSSYGKLEEKLEIIRQRNQAKKEKIYQTRMEANESDAMKVREPLYVSKRELKDSVIYESQQEAKDTAPILSSDGSARSSPYELSDANHLSRREPLYQSKTETKDGESETFQEIDFSKLRLTESKTDTEKEQCKNIESNVLKGEPVYAPRLHAKAEHISNALKVTSAPVPYESSTSMETHYASECSMNFENKPQSTPYTSQDLLEKSTKGGRTVTFCEQILEKSCENSNDNSENTSKNDSTVVNNDCTVIKGESSGDGSVNDKSEEVEPDGPHTTWGIFDSEGGMLEDRHWGVSLIIPPKAIAPGIKQKIYFTVSDPRLSQRVGGPPIDMDNGEAMLSPLVMCGPQGLVFLKPVTLRLPHCANAVPSLGLTIKATDTEAHLSTDWDQIHLPATTTLNTVAVKVDHF